MKLPLFIAHGQDAIPLFLAIVLATYMTGIISLAYAIRKKRELISKPGIVWGLLGVCVNLWMLWLSWPISGDNTLPLIVVLLPFAISISGFSLSLLCRKKKEA